ncbi:hypothetical protein EWI07_00600 [Sporolactobacillus sp. THM7-4]|nr:hypothetical protein EWI07_00600 [Sporolactobacillus sp. THM7-4]
MIETTAFHVVLAVLSVLILTQAVKLIFRISAGLIPFTALTFGLCFSALIEGRTGIAEGLLNGILYGLAGIGTYAMIKTLIRWYRHRKEGPFR